jgi:hypothetical protein
MLSSSTLVGMIPQGKSHAVELTASASERVYLKSIRITRLKDFKAHYPIFDMTATWPNHARRMAAGHCLVAAVAGSFGVMRGSTPRFVIVAVGALALVFCFVSLRDVPRNGSIRNPQPSMAILITFISLTTASCTWACLRDSKAARYIALIASGLGILFSVVLACV